MGLIISNYTAKMGNSGLGQEVIAEDEAIMKKARSIVSSGNFGKGAIIVSEVLHTDVPTSNGWAYSSSGINSHVGSFYTPAYTPFLMHHNDGSGGFFSEGDASLISVGTNLFAKYINKDVNLGSRGVAKGYVKVATFIPEDREIAGSKVINLIQARNLMQLSVTSRTAKENHKCNICNKPYHGEDCDHKVFQLYEMEDGTTKQCFINLFKPRFTEYSAVYDPADIDAQIRRMEMMDSEDGIYRQFGQLSHHDGAHIMVYDSQTFYSSTNLNSGELHMIEKDGVKHYSLDELGAIKNIFVTKEAVKESSSTNSLPTDNGLDVLKFEIPTELTSKLESMEKAIDSIKEEITKKPDSTTDTTNENQPKENLEMKALSDKVDKLVDVVSKLSEAKPSTEVNKTKKFNL